MKKAVLLTLWALAAVCVWAEPSPDFPTPDFPAQDFPKQDFPVQAEPSQDFPAAPSAAPEAPAPDTPKRTVSSSSVGSKIKKKAAASAPKKTMAHEAAVFNVLFTLRSQFFSASPQEERFAPKSCPAVLIVKDWLLASLNCYGLDEKNPTPANITGTQTITGALVTSNTKTEFATTSEENIFVDEDAEIILLHVENKHETGLVPQNTVTANLLISNNPEEMEIAISPAFADRENQSYPSATDVVVAEYCEPAKCETVEWTIYQSEADGPLFVADKKKPGKEYVLGFNTTVFTNTGEDAEQYYQLFDEKTLTAIRNILLWHTNKIKLPARDAQKAWTYINENAKTEKTM